MTQNRTTIDHEGAPRLGDVLMDILEKQEKQAREEMEKIQQGIVAAFGPRIFERVNDDSHLMLLMIETLAEGIYRQVNNQDYQNFREAAMAGFGRYSFGLTMDAKSSD